MKLRKIKRKAGAVDYEILATIIMLVAIGVIMVYSSSSYYALYEESGSSYFFIKEIIWTSVGIIAMIVGMSIDYHVYKKWTFLALIITFICLVLVVIGPSSIIPNINGARRWIKVGGLTFQPSELAKYVIVVFLAMSMDIRSKKIKNFMKGPIFYLGFSGVFAGLILAGDSLSISTIIMGVTFIMLIVAGAREKHLIALVGPAIAIVVLFIFTEGYRMERFTTFLDPWHDPSGKSYQLIQSLYALGSGGITGVGFGESKLKTLYMPEPHNDFIFSIIGEELGLIGCLLIIGLFLFLILRGFVIASKAKDNYGLLLATGIVSIIAIQAAINIAVVTGSMPVTGIPLPFISYGGTSMVFNLGGMGVLLNISRQRLET